MSSDKILPVRMITNHIVDFFFRRTDIGHYLTVHLIQYIRDHPDSYTYRHSYDNHIAHSNTFFITDDFVYQSQFLRSRSMQSIRFNPDNTIGKTPVFQIYCHRTTDQSNSYYSNLHINISFYPTFTTASTPRTMFKMTHM